MTPLLLASLLALDAPPPIDASTARAIWLADLHPDRVRAGTTGCFVFVPGSQPDEVDGCLVVEAAGPPLADPAPPLPLLLLVPRSAWGHDGALLPERLHHGRQ